MRAGNRLQDYGSAVRTSLSRYRRALHDRNVALLIGAGFASEIGDWFNTVALISLSFHFSEGAAGVGGMLAVRMLTRLILQGPAGSLVDRFPGRTILFGSQMAMAIVAGAFILLVVYPALWLLFLLVIVLEAANCIARPAFMVELRAEAPEEQQAAALGALYASSTTAQLIGPLLGAVALAPFGPGVVFALNALTFLGVATTVTQLRGGLGGSGIALPHDEPNRAEADPEGLGYRWLLGRKDLVFYALVSLLLALLVQATITLFVIRANAFGLGDGGVGMFYAAVAGGSIAGSIVAGSSGRFAAPLFPAAVAMAASAAALAMFGVASALPLAIIVLVIAGFATDFYEVVGLTYFQHAMPGAVYGRFFSMFLLALSAGGLIGALAGPALERMLGVAESLLVLAAPGLVLALALAGMARRWQAFERREDP